MAEPMAEITRALQTYFDALHDGDVAKVRAVFLPGAHLYSASDGPLLDIPLEKYVEIVAGRPSPRSRGETRRDRIVSVDMSGPQTALAKVECAIGPKLFTDYLTLLKVDGSWRIIAKAYHYVPIG